MRIYVDIFREECPSGKNFYSYKCEEVDSTFTPPFRAYKISPYEQEGFWISLEQEMDGFEYYQSDIIIDLNEIIPNFKPFFLKALTKQLNNNFSEKEVTKNELTELTDQIKQSLPRLHYAYAKGAMAGLFAKIGLPSEIGLYAGNYLTRKDASKVSLSTKIASNTANQGQKREEEIILGYKKI